ncbi:ATP/GTP-binding protein [Streptacidiphilus pinicola]|uniref:ATP/GTP-binding protein n=1 Tax=Streptacidiphilus pinicola TaxID=2219663 RepID=A0A2X0I8M6_9ACTN|nr:ATP/GTP-binding protein [Streptacidiphilus pinicola]
MYAAECPLITGKGLPGGGAQWFQNPPPGFGGAVNVQALAQQAVSKMGLQGPAIGIAPPPGSKGVVGLPVWLWDNVSATTWGPNTASASAGAVTVTAIGSVTQIVWDMGDGQTETCASPGEAYQASFGNAQPPCGHTYTTISGAQPGGKYAINATATWVVNWQATTGQTGQITVTRKSASSVVIGELRDLNN